MTDLYPLKFETVLKEKVWGGTTLSRRYNKNAEGINPDAPIGESWELSGVDENQSVISNGYLAGNNIEELIEVYMGDLIGDVVYEKFGNEFPLLIKFIEAREDLSIQVHPGDELARERHGAYGKTEMWYILENRQGAGIYTGFREGITKEMYTEALANGSLPSILNFETVSPGDAFFTPAGRIHAIGAGIVLVEIQQTSDITYRIFDWNREQKGSEKRELHTDLAIDAIDFSASGKAAIRKTATAGIPENIVSCEYFNVNLIELNNGLNRDYNGIDSFVIYICTEGSFQLKWEDEIMPVKTGETVLLPAMIRDVDLVADPKAKVLEVWIDIEEEV